MPKANLHDLAPETELACDICVIGSGPAGATIAREGAGGSLRVILLESGGEERQPAADALNEIESIGRPREMDQWLVRNRILGGSSHTWAGRCAPFDPIDFEARDWVPGSGWPLTHDQMQPYLVRTAPYVGLGIGADYSDDRFWAAARRPAPQPALNEDLLTPFFWQYSKDGLNRFDLMRWGPDLLAHLPDTVRLLTNATLVRLQLDPHGRKVRSAEVAARDGSRRTVTARSFVLCAGGIENARLLLCSNDVERCGIGNRRDLVGRYLMDHPRGILGHFDPAASTEIRRRFGLHHVRFGPHSYRFRHGFRLSPKLQRREGLLNCTAWLDEEVMPDDPWRALNGLLRGGSRRMKDVRAVLSHADVLIKGAADLVLRKRGLTRRLRALHLVGMTEQVPDRESRITLSDRTDRLGMPLSRIDWRVNAMEEQSLRRLAGLVAAEVARMGYAPPRLDAWVERNEGFPDSFRDVAHPTGTTRMADDPAEGVVDAQGQVHGVDGLFVAGSSVFPTAGHANPTQMIVAMAIRTADILKERHRAPAPAARRDSPAREVAHV
ncbi:GMC family oxidoreductase [Methylobacterium sp.]|uniref:GMC oxidoreductase n=1 Tax=Methylobacterium sp. TaxID=409 RepID=UPI002589382B|nr:GMC family oxidoreductase [Methylobacterium sp.]